MLFEPSEDANKITDAKDYISNMGISEKAKLWGEMATIALAGIPR